MWRYWYSLHNTISKLERWQWITRASLESYHTSSPLRRTLAAGSAQSATSFVLAEDSEETNVGPFDLCVRMAL